jgi:hypothetical protein
MKKARFLGTCLFVFAVLLVTWKVTEGAHWYTDGMLAFAGVVGPMTHGWVLETNPSGKGVPTWVYGNNQVQLSLQFDALAVGLVPLLALLAATPGLGLRRRALLMAVGGGLNFLVDTLIVTLFPLLVFHKNAFTDVVGTFLGLIAFVGAPVIIWFALTFRELQHALPSLRPRAESTRGRQP